MTTIAPICPETPSAMIAAPLATRMYWGTEPTRELHALVASIFGFTPRATSPYRISSPATVRTLGNQVVANTCAPQSASPEFTILGNTDDVLTLIKSLLAAVNSKPRETADFIYFHLAPWLKLTTLDPVITQMWRSTNAQDSIPAKARH